MCASAGAAAGRPVVVVVGTMVVIGTVGNGDWNVGCCCSCSAVVVVVGPVGGCSGSVVAGNYGGCTCGDVEAGVGVLLSVVVVAVR